MMGLAMWSSISTPSRLPLPKHYWKRLSGFATTFSMAAKKIRENNHMKATIRNGATPLSMSSMSFFACLGPERTKLRRNDARTYQPNSSQALYTAHGVGNGSQSSKVVSQLLTKLNFGLAIQFS